MTSLFLGQELEALIGFSWFCSAEVAFVLLKKNQLFAVRSTFALGIDIVKKPLHFRRKFSLYVGNLGKVSFTSHITAVWAACF